MITTLGIDLASQPRNTALCEITWDAGAATVTQLQLGALDDETLRRAIRDDHAKVGIDAPFGWPAAFVAALTGHERFERWPSLEASELAYRETDRFVHAHASKLPLSVSTDRIAYCAFRCARLLSGLDAPRDGRGLVVEAYPDAALRCWLRGSFDTARAPSYKGEAGSKRRADLVDILLSGLGEHFDIKDKWRADCVTSDDCLDALLCALVARAAERGETIPPDEDLSASARVEGWIHLPRPDTLATLTD
ncbi:DUF429 domain-containing protein [Solirubrobacter phytolaccae]|uniref:DUF429 domain-containing protein n=1 Tax=Solirubrobacter phytolaccae TaxID=1404360 RepID=A0A9X3N2V8_9ACTN|nr:DUF429 domain-containing protein [Solirubrobacter phytolaccae]MDA0178825.1 DUF429 domain-containing protein [Solirubrobacter phytolaccae]